MIRVLHFADLHLGVENYGRLNPATGLHSRVEDFLRALDALVERAIGERVDAVLFAGDAYRTKDPSVTHQREFAKRLARLIRADIPTVLLTGNHDIPNARGRATSLDIYDALALERVKVITSPETFALPTRSGPLQIVGLPWLQRSRVLQGEELPTTTAQQREEQLAGMAEEWLRNQAKALDPSVPAVALVHASVHGARFGSERSLILGSDLVLLPSWLDHSQFTYIGLGHIHRYQRLQTVRPAFYAGSLERVDFGEEGEEKGYLLVDLEPGRAHPTFCRWDARPFLTIDVKLPADDEEPTQRVLAAIAAKPIADAVLRVRVTGPADRLQQLQVGPIVAAARHAHYFAGLQKLTLEEAREREAERWGDNASIAQVMAHYWEQKRLPEARRQRLLEAAEALISGDAAV